MPFLMPRRHDMLDGAIHTDSVADTVTRGSVIVGNATSKWDELVLGVADRVLKSDGSDPAWSQVGHDELGDVATADHHTKYTDPEARTAVPYIATITFGWDPQSPQVFAP